MDKHTGIKARKTTVDDLRAARVELITVLQRPIMSDDETIGLLIDHWRNTKPEVVQHEAIPEPA